MRKLIAVGLAASLGLGCTAAVTGTAQTAPTGRASKAPAVAAAAEAFRAVGPDARATTLVGRVRLLESGAGLISDHGAGLISDNGLGVVSNNGSQIVANNGGSIVANNGGGLVGKTRFTATRGYALLAAGREANLADAAIEVLDAAGKVLTDAKGQPVTTTTDGEGRYRLAAALPAEALVLRVKLFPKGGVPAAGGQLLALVPRERGEGPADLDTASTLASAYVLDRFVAGQPDPGAVLGRLPAAEAAGLHDDLARVLPADLDFARGALAAGAAALEAADKPVAARLARIKAILLAGQAALGEGLPATAVSLAGPIAVASDGRGGFYVAEILGRVRHVAADGTIRLHASVDGTGDLAARGTFAKLGGLLALPDGALLLADALANKVWRVPAEGAPTVVLGTGRREQGALAASGPETSIMGPAGLARGADGTLYVPEIPRSAGLAGRVIAIAPDGTPSQVPLPPAGETVALAGVAAAADGALWVLNAEGPDRWLRRRAADGTWASFALDAGTNEDSRLLALPDGSVLATEPAAHRIARYAPDGTRTVVAGTGQAGTAPDGTPAAAAALNGPVGLALLEDGDVLVTEPGSGLVRRLVGFAGGQPTIETVAGTRAAAQVGDARTIALNVPGGVAFDPQGRLLIAETGGDTIKRLDGGLLSAIAGSVKGFGGDGGPAAAARFSGPMGLAFGEGVLYVVDAANERIRAIAYGQDPPTVTTVAGHGQPGGDTGPKLPALAAKLPRPFAIAVGPDGRPYWSDTALQTVSRLNADGTVEVVAGTIDEKGFAGDGGPARQARFTHPAGLAFDAAGDLYVADAGNACVRKIAQVATDPAAIITRVVGADTGAAGAGLGALLAGGAPDPAADEGKPARDVVLYLPLALAFDGQGRLHVAEGGTAQLQALAGLLAGAQADQLTRLLGLLPPVGARIRRVDADGGIHTVAGPGGRALTAAGGDDALAVPVALAFDRDGSLVVSDGGANQLKRVPAAALGGP